MIIEYVRDARSNSELDTSCIPGATQSPSQREMVYTPAWVASYTPCLCIVLKVYMEAYSVAGSTGTIADANQNQVTVTNWNAEIFENFCRRLKDGVEAMWNNRLWLIPSDNWGFDRGRSFRPNIRCAIRIDILHNENASRHLHIRCVNLPTGPANHRSFAIPSQNLIQMDSRDGPRTAAHEIGHHLGLGHVNQRSCINAGLSTNLDICYGYRDTYQRGDIMGAGVRVEEWHSQIWRNRIGRHAPHASVTWRAVTSEPQPQHIMRLSST